MLNQCNFIGTLGKDPEQRAAGAHTIVSFSLAVKNRKKETTWINCQAWDKTGETLINYCKKGMILHVNTEYSLQEWDKPDGTKGSKALFTVQSVSIITWPKKDEDNEAPVF